jgi:hypothetical protein
MICLVCLDSSRQRCMICGRAAVIKKNLTPQQLQRQERNEARIKFLKEQWQKLKKFKTPTTGSPDLDHKLKLYFGEWL